MPEASTGSDIGARGRSTRTTALVALFLLLFVALFAWAKWTPYWSKVPVVAAEGALGESAIGNGDDAASVSLASGFEFLTGYVLDVWPAIVAGLVVAAGIQTLLPRRLLFRALGLEGGPLSFPTGRAVLTGLPMMLCTCCSAPIAVALRRSNVPVRPALAMWLSTPLLNPVVLAFALFVLSPAWTGLRLGAGVIVACAAIWLATARPRVVGASVPPVLEVGPHDARPAGLSAFLSALMRLTLRLLPEYLLLVFALGALRGWLFPIGHDLASWGLVAVVLLAVTGMMLAVPTGGEIAVVAALLAAGFPGWLAATLLVTLPAVSLPSLSMVSRSFPRAVTLTVPVVVVAGGVLSAGAAWAIGL